MRALRVAVLATGGGTTAEYVLKATLKGDLNGIVEVVCLVTKEGAGVIQRFKSLGFPGHILPLAASTLADQKELAGVLRDVFVQEDVQLFHQLGWIPKTPKDVIVGDRVPWYGINQHPAPVPYFGGQGMYGLAPHAAILNFARLVDRPVYTEATSQLVAAEYDMGPRICAVPVPVDPAMTPEQLQVELLPFEWECQVRALKIATAYSGNFPSDPAKWFCLREEEHEILERARAKAREDYPRG